MKIHTNYAASAVGFQSGFFLYGRNLKHSNYQINYLSPIFKFVYIIYRSKRKPLLKPITTLNALLPLLVAIEILIVALLCFLVLIAGFFVETLFKKSFITTWYDKASGYLSLALACIGVYHLLTIIF